MNAINTLEKLQYGIETTPGTLVAADAVMLAEQGGEFTEEIDRVSIDEPRGVLAMVEDSDQRKGSLLSYGGALDFEQVLMPLLCGVKSVSPVNATGVYTWTVTPGMTAPDTLKAATWEVAYTDGSNKHVELEFGFGTVSKFTIEFAYNQPAKITVEVFGRTRQTSTFTTALAPVAREVIPSNAFGVYIDDAAASYGGTQKSGLIRSGKLEIVTGAAPDYSLNARSDLDMTQLVRGMITGSLSLNMAVDANFATELGKYRDSSLRFVRLKALGTSPRALTFDVSGRYTSPPKYGVDRGLRVAELAMDLRYDGTGGNLLSAVVVNSLSGF
ncbi:hypothetical protein UFOVP1383_34 [uncultured Caudovirales phage]|uniref:Tail protein n=1 Tax=uncultured Caudovirales phage TaxID=2100421 RepID=A0A6J5S6Q2_9CAUD|nr:hypothetical protein UFOVP848_7 [uncultured Caudovirales phage]CAB4173416.1 hypothetical protein UFOVP945_58 [uncultured Caudovirales phage]CAB4179669.1 hypothetical protein UFOVP1023_43 [uncultured Caudovirales phage]CAB4204145.1 hypothetical protein UFOVP1383_34 [uncultured Caudovirales phage]CAB4215858.1 hypothetical protein UFOVP1477_14 [uncultured Caudovirales phage]